MTPVPGMFQSSWEYSWGYSEDSLDAPEPQDAPKAPGCSKAFRMLKAPGCSEPLT